MTPEEAIKKLEHIATYRDCFDNTGNYHAIKLGISALEAFLFARSGGSWDPRALLPGETSQQSTYAQERIPSF